MKLPRIRYNSPVILTFTLVSFVALFLSKVTGGSSTATFFTAYPSFSLHNIFHYAGFVTHIFGHANWAHLSGNFILILLIGPLLEERHGSVTLLEMIVITALITSVCNALFFNNGLIGASGIVFMMILLGSFANFRRGEIPLTFILVAVFFLGKEIIAAFGDDYISQYAHIMGGLIGAGFGFLLAGRGTRAPKDDGPSKGTRSSDDGGDLSDNDEDLLKQLLGG